MSQLYPFPSDHIVELIFNGECFIETPKLLSNEKALEFFNGSL